MFTSTLRMAIVSLVSASSWMVAQGGGRTETALVARGQYLVEGVAVCWRCHTPRDARGNPDRTQWLMGAPVLFEPTTATASWAQVAPRLAGVPPGTDEQFMTLMMTGVSRKGRPPAPPMPRFEMTREDAESILAYLKSLKSPSR